ncbi:hypothetical protein EIQ28_22140 [Xanthomonas campestris pv. plantaginis]
MHVHLAAVPAGVGSQAWQRSTHCRNQRPPPVRTPPRCIHLPRRPTRQPPAAPQRCPPPCPQRPPHGSRPCPNRCACCTGSPCCAW